MVSSTPRPHFTSGKDTVPIVQEAGWVPGPVLKGGKSRPHQDSIPHRPARSSVAIPTELPTPHTHCSSVYKIKNYNILLRVEGRLIAVLRMFRAVRAALWIVLLSFVEGRREH